LTYPEHGATRAGLPSGYDQVTRDVSVGRGRAAFDRAARGLLGWQMHRAAGMSVAASAPTAEVGAVVVLGVGWGPLRLPAPCRVVYRVDESDRRGFAYGTLPGHPERGEESFVLELRADGEVRFAIRAFSRPATALARAGGPLTRVAQALFTDRYVRALRRIAGSGSG
jgi:uncharacterized protein (UPF0548 family)